MEYSSIITLNEKSVQKNVSFLRKKLGAKVRISAVVKANAYGHGIEQIIPLFEKHGITHFSVFCFNEAMRVKNSVSSPVTIMIMGYIADENVADAIENDIEFFIFNLQRLEFALEKARLLNKKAKIHLEAETGMNRSGLDERSLNTALHLIKENPEYFDLIGYCTHLAGAESISNHVRIQHQLKKYHKLYSLFEAYELIPKIKHVANSAAAIVYPKTRMDLVRIGIMMYGFWSSAEVFIQYINSKKIRTDPLDRILGWQSQVMSVKKVKTGEFISYGNSYLAQTDITTALIPVGYSCGYSRSLSNKGRVLIHGKRCSVIGVVNMNMIIVDITNVYDVKEGDEVVIIGKQGDLEIKVSAFSDISDQLNYEVLAHLSGNISRIVINKI